MSDCEIVYIVDAGNTSIKLACFENESLTSVKRLDLNNLLTLSDTSNIKENLLFCSSVLNIEKEQILKEKFQKCIFLSIDSILPIKIEYLTPKTLGKDRICNVIGGLKICPNKNVLTIDIGTCIKYDFIDKNATYKGGSISPGVNLRYKSLHHFTDNLPLIENFEPINQIGTSTIESIHSGVINGVVAEINGIIQRYQEEFDDLQIIITGGDSKYFDFNGKNNTFVDENLTIKGLFEIYKLNATK